MFNEIEKRSILGFIKKQNVITMKDFESAYENRDEIKIYEDKSLDGSDILVIEKDDQQWYMQSRYNAGKACADWLLQFENKIIDDTIVLVFGLGNGTYIERLMELNQECTIIIYEPCANVFWHVFGDEKIAKMLEDDRVFLTVEGISDGLFSAILETFINYANFSFVINAVLPNYPQMFVDKYKWALDRQLYEIKRVLLNRNTEVYFSEEMLGNVMKLSKDIMEQYSIVQLKEIVQKKGLNNMPAVLIAAGPSLDKNIEKLKQIKDNVFIMAVDTALNTVLKHDIIPDMTISVDGHKPLVLFEDERIKNIPISVSPVSNAKVIEMSRAKKFYELSEGEYLSKLYHAIGKDVQGLPTGGSVSNNACSLLVLMGFQTIIFMGLDLAYPGGVKHTQEAYNQEDKIDFNNKKYVEILDINGNKAYTETNMQLYLKWFETYIQVKSHIRFIDATEGGAMIRGAEVKSMDEVIKEIATADTYDKAEIWKGMNPYLDVSEQEKIKQLIREIPENLDIMEKWIKEGISIYEKLDKVNRKSNGTSEKIGKYLNRITELNELIENEMVFDLIKYHAMEVDYEVKGQVLHYNRTDTMYEQVKGLIYNGKMLYEGYMSGIKSFRKTMGEWIKQFESKKE